MGNPGPPPACAPAAAPTWWTGWRQRTTPTGEAWWPRLRRPCPRRCGSGARFLLSEISSSPRGLSSSPSGPASPRRGSCSGETKPGAVRPSPERHQGHKRARKLRVLAKKSPRDHRGHPAASTLPVSLQQVLGEAAGGEALRAGLLALVMLVVLKVLDNVPHIAGFDCWGEGEEGTLVRRGRRSRRSSARGCPQGQRGAPGRRPERARAPPSRPNAGCLGGGG